MRFSGRLKNSRALVVKNGTIIPARFATDLLGGFTVSDVNLARVPPNSRPILRGRPHSARRVIYCCARTANNDFKTPESRRRQLLRHAVSVRKLWPHGKRGTETPTRPVAGFSRTVRETDSAETTGRISRRPVLSPSPEYGSGSRGVTLLVTVVFRFFNIRI